ncbi:hypothetical protein [Ferrovum sp.]|uniref:hypothetical protein n=1 Tax=Ferrovum sp. TaxID=2609467 RepID=UPI002602546E|nr:hypothetical protein [Ferrovum sp.]
MNNAKIIPFQRSDMVEPGKPSEPSARQQLHALFKEPEPPVAEQEYSEEEKEGLLNFLFSGSNEVLFSDEEGVLSPDTFAGNKAPSLGKNGRKGIRLLPEDAFDPDTQEYFVFMSIFSAILTALGRKSKNPLSMSQQETNLQQLALEWLFVPNVQDTNGLTFELGCASLDVRPNLIRTRLHFEFYKRMLSGIRLPFLSCRLPPRFRLEASGIAGDLGEDILTELWMQPGYRADLFKQIIDPPSNEEFNHAIDSLDANGNLAIKNGLIYFTGRNPITLRYGTRFNWTHLTGLD